MGASDVPTDHDGSGGEEDPNAATTASAATAGNRMSELTSGGRWSWANPTALAATLTTWSSAVGSEVLTVRRNPGDRPVTVYIPSSGSLTPNEDFTPPTAVPAAAAAVASAAVGGAPGAGTAAASGTAGAAPAGTAGAAQPAVPPITLVPAGPLRSVEWPLETDERGRRLLPMTFRNLHRIAMLEYAFLVPRLLIAPGTNMREEREEGRAGWRARSQAR